MSEGQRIKLADAERIAGEVEALLGMRHPECSVVGSVRRKREDVGDIEMIAPMPSTSSVGIPTDYLRMSIMQHFAKADPDSVFPAGDTIISGAGKGFRMASLIYKSTKVQIFRYDPGANGNRGWIELMRTGPAEYSERILKQWKFVCGTKNTPSFGSIEGHFVDERGVRVPTPTERAVYELVGLPFTEPENRQ